MLAQAQKIDHQPNRFRADARRRARAALSASRAFTTLEPPKRQDWIRQPRWSVRVFKRAVSAAMVLGIFGGLLVLVISIRVLASAPLLRF